MMEKLYYPYWNIAFIPGLIMFIYISIFIIFILANPDSKLPFISSFYYYFKSPNELGLAIGKIIITFIIHFILCPLTILNIFYFSPNFILIIFQFSRIAKNIMNNGVAKLYCLIFYAIQINFCGLNSFTKKNIDKRGIDDILFEGRDSFVSQHSIEIDTGYTINNFDNNDRLFEMKEQEEEGVY